MNFPVFFLPSFCLLSVKTDVHTQLVEVLPC